MASISFFGLGKMGEPMAANLLRAGHRVVIVTHRHREPVERLRAKGATEAPTPADAAGSTDLAITIVPTAAEVEELLFGPSGLAEKMRPGYTVIDMSTSYPPDTRRVAARLKARGGRMLDAPVTGGPGGARDATLTIMVGGDEAVLADVRPVLEAMGTHIFHFGNIGAGHTAKLVQNLIGIVANAGIAEGFALAAAEGLDVSRLFEMLTASSSNSPALQHAIRRIFARDFDDVRFRLDLSYKDLRQATALARERTLPLLTANGAVEFLQLARAAGYGHQDTLAAIRGLERVAGLEVRGEVRTED